MENAPGCTRATRGAVRGVVCALEGQREPARRRTYLDRRPARSRRANPRRHGREERRLRELPHGHRSENHAPQPGRRAGMHRLPRRRFESRGAGRRQPSRAELRRGHGTRARVAALSLGVARQRQPRTQLHPAQQGSARVHPLPEPRRLPDRSRKLRRLPPADHRGRRAQPDGHRHDAVRRRGVQQRHPAVQALHDGRGLHARGAAGQGREPGEPRRQHGAPGRDPRDLPAAGLGSHAAGRRVPRVRTRRTQHRLDLRRDRHPQFARPDPAPRGTRSPRSQAVQPGSRHRQSHRGALAQHAQDASQRPVHVVSRHQRPAGRLPLLGLLGLPRRVLERS